VKTLPFAPLGYAVAVCVVAALLAITRANVARAQTAPTAYAASISRVDVPDRVAAYVALITRQTMPELPGVETRAASGRAWGQTSDVRDSVLYARGLLVEAQRMAMGLRYDAAAAQAMEATQLFEMAAPELEDLDELASALMFLGSCLEYDGREAEAERVYRRIQLQFPSYAPDPVGFSPEIVDSFDVVRQRERRRARGRISVRAPGGAAGVVLVDGVAVSTLPALVDGVAPGAHFVDVFVFGGTREHRTVEVRSGRTEELLVPAPADGAASVLVDLRETLFRGGIRPEAQHAARIGTALAVEVGGLVFVSAVDRPGEVGLELVVADRASGREHFRESVSSSTERDDLAVALRGLLRRGFAAGVARGRDVTTAPIAEVDLPLVDDVDALVPITAVVSTGENEGRPIASEWWFWAAMGGGAAAIAGVVIGVVVATSGGDSTVNQEAGEVVLRF
jgi:hypothetical protein